MRRMLLALLVPDAQSLVLQSGRLMAEIDDQFPRPLTYQLVSTGETLYGALTGWGFHTSLSINKGQITCGEAGMVTSYNGVSGNSAAFSVSATCLLNWAVAGQSDSPLVTVELNGTIAVNDDPAVAGAGVLSWSLQSATLVPGQGGDPPTGLQLTTLDVAGLELASFRPVPVTPQCMYSPTDLGQIPACGGDYYYVDTWTNDGIDEWWSGTWGTSTVTGNVDVNTVAGTNQACIDGVLSRHAPGPLASVIAGGWSKSGRTGIAAISSEKHLPFWTGLRAYDLPGRCSIFTVAPSTIHLNYLCGSGLPYTITVGVFPDVTADGAVDQDDVNFWRRFQYPRADVLYRTSLPYKLQIDMTSYTPSWSRIPFVDVLGYVSNISAITDGYPQTPILVGWQGLGHDTLYPGWDTVNIRPDVGGAAGLQALAAGFLTAARNNRSSLSYHVNADEAYSLFNGTANPSFLPEICRLNVDHTSVWAMNCTTVDFQTPDCGIRCSISKSKDNALYGRYERYARLFDTVPQTSTAPLRTIHSDAWRDVGASWEPQPPAGLGFIDWANEQRCGQQADSAFWASHGMSMGVEGNDGQAAELMGTVSFLYHSGAGWSTVNWGRWVSGTDLGWDLDVSCNNPGWKCSWTDMADSFYLTARVYQLALTDELLGARSGVYRFANGGALLTEHVKAYSQKRFVRPDNISDVPIPSSWPYGGDSIPILDGNGGALLPLVMADGLSVDPDILHAYQHSNGPMPDRNCALYSTNASVYSYADNTAVSNWNEAGPFAPYLTFEGQAPPAPQDQFYSLCNATCWANASCVAWDVIKVTPTSGRTKPVCMLFDAVAGCDDDSNQVAGVKSPVPMPAPPAGVNQTWTLPLSWVGSTITAVSISPAGLVPNQPSVLLNGRNVTLVGVQPGWPVRLTRS